MLFSVWLQKSEEIAPLGKPPPYSTYFPTYDSTSQYVSNWLNFEEYILF